ncbi:MAG: hypothetical protein IBJ12_03325 [Sphingomonadaceae bacterium]|nr:hypothetical protein [Sphingomonadaceae bacterium]
MADGIQSIAKRVEPLIDLMALRNPVTRRFVLLLAAAGFLAGIWISFRAQPDILTHVAFTPLILLIAVAIPVTLALNALEFLLSARLVGQKLPFRKSMEITLIGSVANMLPLPGGTMMRIASLKAEGASFAKSTSATLYVALIWCGIGLIYSGSWLTVLGQHIGGMALVAGGGTILAVCISATYRILGDVKFTNMIVAAKIILVLVDAWRTYLSLLALGMMVSFGQASVLALSSLLGASFSIVPAGLGIREGAAALLGPVVGVSAASAFLATSLSRILGMAVTFPLALALALKKSER